MLRNRGCSKCGRQRTADAKKHDDEYYIEQCKNRDFTYVGRYIKNNNTVIQYICNKHSYLGVQEKHISNFEKTFGCPVCKSSKGEVKIKDLLLKCGYKFDQQYRFEDCKDIYTLPFDFYVRDFNVAIEYDGEFHYSPIKLSGMTDKSAAERFELIQRHDKIKTQYCSDNNIPLIRIPYWKSEDLEYFLFDEFKKYGVII